MRRKAAVKEDDDGGRELSELQDRASSMGKLRHSAGAWRSLQSLLQAIKLPLTRPRKQSCKAGRHDETTSSCGLPLRQSLPLFQAPSQLQDPSEFDVAARHP